MSAELYRKYFPDLNAKQVDKLVACETLYKEWNDKINVVSRKDINNLDVHHILHSMGIAKIIQPRAHTRILDIGTGGGFPGIPLAIMFPETKFVLADSIEKKIGVVRSVASQLDLLNVYPVADRVENVTGRFDYIVSRAVAKVGKLIPWISDKLELEPSGDINGGIYLLKGGPDLENELKEAFQPGKIIDLNQYFEEEFFETKKVVSIMKLNRRYL